jgi:hypothetical protein
MKTIATCFKVLMGIKRTVTHPYAKILAILTLSLGMVGWSSSSRRPIELAGQWPGYARGSALDICVREQYAYVAAGRAGFMVFDVSDPAQPVRVGGAYTTGEARSVYVDGNRAYLAMGSFDTGGCAMDAQGRLVIMDVSNPALPVRLGEYRLNGAGESVVVSNNIAYVAVGEGGLQVVDASDPTKPVGVGSFLPAAFVGSVAIGGSYIYATVGGDGLQVVDVSNPAKPVCVGRYSTGDARAVDLSGHLAFVADSGKD